MEMSRQESRNSACNIHRPEQAGIMELKAIMKLISRLKSGDSAGSSLGTKQALITQLSKQ